MSTIDNFFGKPRSQSEIKTEIVLQYFKAWASILLLGQKQKPVRQLLYIDLFAGKGFYNDGKLSTPILILESINANNIFNRKIKTFFNDNKLKVSKELEQNILNLPYYERLLNKPIVLNKEANVNLLRSLIFSNPDTPAFTFLDPFGYKGVSSEICNLALNQWGSDLFLFFNLNRIRAALSNQNVQHLMRELFGAKYHQLIERVEKLRGKRKEDFILDSFESIFKEKKYLTIDFKIEFRDKKQTSHYLLFVTKSRLGYIKMKEIFAKYSVKNNEGIPHFEYLNKEYYYELFPKFSIARLANEILQRKELYDTKTVYNIYELDNIDKPYIKDNYKKAIGELHKQGLVLLRNIHLKETERITFTARVCFN
jgi:three-Cys-motif partner protein